MQFLVFISKGFSSVVFFCLFVCIFAKCLCFCLWQQVQSKVNLKYDSWHKEVLSKFGQMLGQNMQDFHAQISKVIHNIKKIYLLTNPVKLTSEQHQSENYFAD